MRRTTFASISIALILSSMLSGAIAGLESMMVVQAQNQKDISQKYKTSWSNIPQQTLTGSYTSNNIAARSIVAGIALCVVGIIAGAVIATIFACSDKSIRIDNPTFSIVPEDYDGIQVGDHFRVEGSVGGYAGQEGHTNSLTIEGRLREVGSSSWEWEDSAKTTWEDGGDFSSVPFSFEFQATDTGTVEIEVRAKVKGWKGTWLCFSEDSETKTSSWIRKTVIISKPYVWAVDGPSPSAVYHPPHISVTESTLTSKVTSKTNAKLTGYLYIDDKSQYFSLNKDEYEELPETKSHPCWPHIIDSEFEFENIKLEVEVKLDNGRYWKNTETKSNKKVTCYGSVNLGPYDDNLPWGKITPGIQPGYEGTQLAFEFLITGIEPPGISLYTWDFDDGSATVTGKTAYHTYENDGLYNVSMTVQFLNLTTVTEKKYVNIDNLNPTVNIYVVDHADVGNTVKFNSTASDPGINDVLHYEWIFGDGTSITGANVTHSYSNYGFYRYVIVVTDDHYGFAMASGLIWIKGTPPVANVGGPYSGSEGSLIEFDGTASYDSDGIVGQWIWDFGDGTCGYGQMANHTYINDGIYTVELAVLDDNALLPITNDTATVTVSDTDPELDRLVVDYETYYRVRFSAEYNAPNPFTDLTYTWDFDDGSPTKNGRTVEHTYTSGTYWVTLNVSDEDTFVLETEQVSIPATSVSSFSLDVDPSYRKIFQGGSTHYDVTVTAFDNFSSPLTMSVLGLPTGANGNFENLQSEYPYANITLSITTSSVTPSGIYDLTIRGKCDEKSVDISCTLEIEELGDVGGFWVSIDKLGLLAPYIALVSTILVVTFATAISVKSAKRRKEKQ